MTSVIAEIFAKVSPLTKDIRISSFVDEVSNGA